MHIKARRASGKSSMQDKMSMCWVGNKDNFGPVFKDITEHNT